MTKQKQWCFHIRNANSGEKLVGGTMTAPTMEDAAREVIRLEKIEYRKEEERSESTGLVTWVNHFHYFRDKKVNLYITAHPEYL